MTQSPIIRCKFSIQDWSHLYSLEQAITRAEDATGKSLEIQGSLRNQAFLDNQDIDIEITFINTDKPPNYTRSADGHLILGQMHRSENKLHCRLTVDNKVYEELRKNLIEYVDIDGIHIIVSLGLLSDTADWPINESKPIIQLDYAMRGDA